MCAMPFKQAQSQVPAAEGNQYETYLFVDSAQLSYYDVSGGVSSEDIYVRVYLNIVRKSDGSIGYPPERLDYIKEILDNSFNPHDIYFIYDCEEHFMDDAIEWSGFSLSPVPATGEITVTWDFKIDVEGYQIYDIHGQLLQSRAMPLTSGSTVDVSELPAGMYESTPKTSFYYKWLQNPISSSSGKIFPQRSYGYACGIFSPLPRS